MFRITSSSFRTAVSAAFVLVAVSLPVGAASAQTTTLNFDGVGSSQPVSVANNYTESGYKLTAVGNLPTDSLAFANSFSSFTSGDAGYTGTPALFLNSGPATQVDFTRTDGGMFSFQSIGMAAFMAGDTTNVKFTGFGPGSTSIFQMFTVTSSGLQNFSLTGFTNLSSVRMEALNQYGEPIVQFDNVSFAAPASTVPEPATFGLVATGLIGMAGAVRRRAPRRKTS